MSKLKLAVEVISAHNLMPKDGQGSSSPYIEVAVESPYFFKIIIIEAVQIWLCLNSVVKLKCSFFALN